MTTRTPPTFVGAPHVRLQDVQVLSDNWYVLCMLSFELRRRDGSWQTLNREAYDRGNGAVLLLSSPARGTVVLTRQFRLPVFINGGGGLQAEGEDIEVIEMPLQEALEGKADSRICDAKTIMLLQHVAPFENAPL